MKLSKVYSSDKRFKSVLFRSGFNIVLGKVTKPDNLNEDSHNLGKSTLAELLNFLLLEEISNQKKYFLTADDAPFARHTFFLEIELNSGEYLTIKRAVQSPSKISFKQHDLPDQDFKETNEGEWDEEALPFQKARDYLDKVLAFNSIDSSRYRDFVTYFLRTQSDYNDTFQLDKFKQGKDLHWKPLVFQLLGFDSDALERKYEKDDELKALKTYIETRKKSLSAESTQLDRVSGLLQVKQAELMKLSSELDDFDFVKREGVLKANLIDDIEVSIAQLNTRDYTIKFELEKINESLKSATEFDLDAAKQIFQEAKIYFPDQLSKSYNDLINFNREISQERNKFLKKKRLELLRESQEISVSLEKLNHERMAIMAILKESDTFTKYRTLQKSYRALQDVVSGLERQRDELTKLKDHDSELEEIRRAAKALVAQIDRQIEGGNPIYSGVRKTFNEIVKDVLGKTAIISTDLNKEGNPVFDVGIQKDDSTLGAAGKGYSYKKLLCAAFDLAILINYSKKSFFRFVYHDGVFESLDDRKKINYLKTVRSICREHGLQYIMTLLEHDIPREHGELVRLEESEIAVTLSDAGDEGLLFGFQF